MDLGSISASRAAPLHDSEGNVTSNVEIYSDITNGKQTQVLLEHMARHDHLTGLPNRAVLRERITAAVSHAEDGKPAVRFSPSRALALILEKCLGSSFS
jgi:hypothetical protein